MDRNDVYMIPTSIKEVKALGWDYIDVIIFTGDAFVDHPSALTSFIEVGIIYTSFLSIAAAKIAYFYRTKEKKTGRFLHRSKSSI